MKVCGIIYLPTEFMEWKEAYEKNKCWFTKVTGVKQRRNYIDILLL